MTATICNLKSEIRNPRRGVTLVELLVVCAVMTLLLGIAAAVTHTMYRAQRSTRDDVTWRRVLARLSLQLREDGHAARRAEVGPTEGGQFSGQLTLIGTSQQTIQYVFHDDRGEIERIVFQDESRVARDTFPLPSNSSVAFQLAGESTPRVMVMKITQLVSGEPDGGERTLLIQAAVGLDAQHDGTQREGGPQE